MSDVQVVYIVQESLAADETKKTSMRQVSNHPRMDSTYTANQNLYTGRLRIQIRSTSNNNNFSREHYSLRRFSPKL